MSKSVTQKETIEYDLKFLEDWNQFCDTKGYVKRQAAHACRLGFMSLSPEQREAVMSAAMASLRASKKG